MNKNLNRKDEEETNFDNTLSNDIVIFYFCYAKLILEGDYEKFVDYLEANHIGSKNSLEERKEFYIRLKGYI